MLTQCFSCVDSRWRQHPGRCGLNIAQWGVRSDVRQVTCTSLWHWYTQREGLKTSTGLLRSQGWFINYWFTYCWVFPPALLDQRCPWGEERGKQMEDSYLEWHGTILLFRFHYCYKIVCSCVNHLKWGGSSCHIILYKPYTLYIHSFTFILCNHLGYYMFNYFKYACPLSHLETLLQLLRRNRTQEEQQLAGQEWIQQLRSVCLLGKLHVSVPCVSIAV